MEVSYRYIRLRLSEAGVLPRSRVARIAWYLLGIDIALFALQELLGIFKVSYAQGLSGWVSFLSFVVIVLFAFLGLRWLRSKLLWRLRNRLIVTYMFIGVIPVALLVTMASITIYLFAGQFANFVVTSDLSSRLRSLQAVNAAIANELAARIARGQPPTAESLEGLRRNDPSFAPREICAWENGKLLALCGGTKGAPAFDIPSFLGPHFGAIVGDRGGLYLRSASVFNSNSRNLVVISSEQLDRNLLDKTAADLGEIALYAANFEQRPMPVQAAPGPDKSEHQYSVKITESKSGFAMGAGQEELHLMFVSGHLPDASGVFDRVITFGTPLPVTEWATGQQKKVGALLRVETRPSMLYARLFATFGDFVRGVELILFVVAITFSIIELLALFIGTRLTRSVTGAVAHLYQATKHINRGDFSHRIPVKSSDQLAALANSFNSMTASIEKLIEEQKAKQRLEHELAIAQEVQAMLFPQQISQLPSLEVHGFCRPARTVSGDYYDFLTVNPNRLILAVGDISGKGISAALLMATIHSAVRAYSIEGIPVLRETVAVGQSTSSAMRFSDLRGLEISPSAMLSLLNHQLYQSTPMEKYATLFLGMYEARDRKLTYSNGGHLPPIILGGDGSLRRLDRGGTVVGLFEQVSYDEATVQLHRGETFLAYSDGVTEPENDFGEFGEQRLIELVQENRHLPLARISEIVTAAVDDWIGANEQPDDVTLVLARAR
ncbi:MAG TPA: SpoIIE family protein phosphatase [Terriglobales bacterium]|nr:SpoIIE family protein phosphatase [Terriglobales bacterium]